MTNPMKPLTLFLLFLAFASQGWGQVQMDRINPAGVDGTIHASRYPGATADAKITAAISSAQCTSSECVIDATGITGAQTFSASVVYPSNKSVHIFLGNIQISGVCPAFDLSNAANGSALVGIATGDLAFGSANVSQITCTSGTDGIKAGNGTTPIYGLRIEHIAVNGNSVAANGFTLNTVQRPVLIDLSTAFDTAIGFELKSTSGSANTNAMWSDIHQLSATNVPVCMQWDNNSAKTSNVTQNVITMFKCSYSGTAGLVANGADNNALIQSAFFRAGGTGPSVLLHAPDSSNFGALNNSFINILGGAAGAATIVAQTGTYNNSVWSYDTTNGEAFPSLQGNAEFNFEGSIMCGPSGCPAYNGTNPTRWLMAQANANNSTFSVPANLNSGEGLAWNWSNGHGEGDMFVNLGGLTGADGLFEFWNWNGTTATSYAKVPNSPIGNIEGVAFRADQTGLSANVGATTLVAAGNVAGGTYRVSCYTVVTTAATTSSTLPSCSIFYADNDTAVTENPTISATNTGNTVGTNSQGSQFIDVRGGQAITYLTSGYASSGATAMQYAVHLRVEYANQ